MPDRLPPWGGRYAQRITALVLAVKGTDCHLCGAAGGATTADHVLPRSRGGDDSLANLEPACQPCNSARGDRSLADWFAAHPKPTRAALPPSPRWVRA